MWSKHARLVGVALLMIAVALFAGWMFTTPAVAQSTQTPAAPAAVSPAVQPETCIICHAGSGAQHQTYYNQLYQDGVIKVADIAYTFTPTGTTTVTWKMTKDGLPFDARKADSLNIYFANYDGKGFGFDPVLERVSLKGKLSYDGNGGNTSTLVSDIPDFTNANGMVVLFGTDEVVGTLPARIQQGKYPFAGLLKMGAVDYASAANASGCENCHTTPYLKHGYIYAQVDKDPATDFYTCKACHQDNGEGGHFEWQLAVNDPKLGAEVAAGKAQLSDEQKAQYAYRTTLMNDVHMSHSMEFPYPQSMANCVTCHSGKLDKVLADENFTAETCKSCHPVTGDKDTGTDKYALQTLMPAKDHEKVDLNKDACTDCHETGKKAKGFKEIHSGYDKSIYTAEGLKYSDAISVTIDGAKWDGKQLTFEFSTHQSPDLAAPDATTITPTVMVGLYGYDTKDFIIGPHERLIDDNGDGKIDNKDQRNLEYVIGSGDHPRMKAEAAGGGKWTVTADLSTWSKMIDDKTVKRVEIAVMPALMNDKGTQVALDAPSRTFDLAANDFADKFYAPIVKVTDGCNNCHGALGTTFHAPDRGGNVVVCRMCHITKSGAAHLEMQSRSIDSYVHAIHSGQLLDIADIDFSDPVQAEKAKAHTEFPFPAHGTDCEACHVKGTENVPDQTTALPAILSASATLKNGSRAIPADIPSVVTGPASKACGGCHRAQMINEDKPGKLIPFNVHTANGGYMVPAGDDPVGTWSSVLDQIIAAFK